MHAMIIAMQLRLLPSSIARVHNLMLVESGGRMIVTAMLIVYLVALATRLHRYRRMPVG
jgi:hypothetical protein